MLWKNRTSFSAGVQTVSNWLIDYFSTVKDSFGNSVCSALSGGFDTRLMLACIRKVDINPYLYVYGSQNSRDVTIAKNIADSEKLPLEHIDKSSFKNIPSDNYDTLLETAFYLNDGMGVFGTFDNGSDIITKTDRTQKANLQINGVGGEIFRSFWRLAHKKYPINTFLTSYYRIPDYSMCKNVFNVTEYFSTLHNKTQKLLGTDSRTINPKQIDMLYPLLRLQYWAGMSASINNQFSYTLTPFTEPELTHFSFDVPYRFKQLGHFESGLIKHIDPAIAKYPSIYGFNFDGKAPLKKVMKNSVSVATPVLLKFALKKLAFIKKLRKNAFPELPYYLQRDYLKNSINFNDLIIANYFNLENIKDAYTLSRALTVELTISDTY